MAAEPTAAEILERVRERYARARSYRDTGEATTVFFHERPMRTHTTVRPFSTAFVRPDRFRFEFRDSVGPAPREPARAVVWMNAEGVQEWWSLQPIRRRPRDLAQALGAFAGVSDGTSCAVPRLLGLCESHPTPPRASTARVVGRDAIEGTDCAVIEGERAMGGTVRLWIDVQALALVRESKATKFDAAWRADNVERMRRALANMAPDDEDHAMMKRMVADQERATPMDFRTESVTVWHPEFDVEIDESSFAFTPPA